MKRQPLDREPALSPDREPAPSPNREPVPSQAAVELRPFPHVVAVARRIDSKRPMRVWSLLPPPSFLRSGRK